MDTPRLLLNGDEAVAHAAKDAGVFLGTGYPGTPSTEILEAFSSLGGNAEWAPNEKVALEVAIGAAFARARVLATMKHVGLNVAADPLFTGAYTGVDGALVVAVADDPGMASSQNEQDSRWYARAAALPILEPSDSQQAYDFFLQAVEISERWSLPVILRLTTRVSHSKSIVSLHGGMDAPRKPLFRRDPKQRVMVPGFARPAHHRLRAKLEEIRAWAAGEGNTVRVIPASAPPAAGGTPPAVIASGISVHHVREAAPEADVIQVAMAHPLPAEAVRAALAGRRAMVVDEGDFYLADALLAAGVDVERKPEPFRYGELDVDRVRRALARDISPEPPPPPGKPPQLCTGCPHRIAYEILKRLDCIVSGDIGCYTLGVMPPFQAVDSCVCMGASITAGLGLRHALPPEDAKRVVSVLGDSTFVHSGLTGLVEMAYNPPASGHVVILLDNSITAMTGMQENPSTGLRLDHTPTHKLVLEDAAKALGIPNVRVINHVKNPAEAEEALAGALASGGLWVFVWRSPCLIALARKAKREAANRAAAEKENA
ncbi:MAG: thiamine pyrophosphate-dependent enzyme [Kiritimatiellia bacterium]|jgi:indolepyruvate ferredoxin oxidoreductase alpha subunit